MIEDNLELEHKHPSRRSPCSRPQPASQAAMMDQGEPRGASSWIKMEVEGIGFMAWQKYWKWYLNGASKRGIQGRCADKETFM